MSRESRHLNHLRKRLANLSIHTQIVIGNAIIIIIGAIGGVILVQGALVGEKRSGTAAWVLSKPISRPAFFLAKLIANAIGTLVTITLAQGLIGYLVIYLGLDTAPALPAFLPSAPRPAAAT